MCYNKVEMRERFKLHVKGFSILMVTIALIAAMEGCSSSPPSEDLEIQTWYDLEAIRNNLSGHHVLMNDLDSTTAGYDELAGPTANDGKGWHPIIGPGGDPPFTGTLDGQGHEIRDMFMDLPGTGFVGLFSIIGEGGRIEDIGLVNVDVTSTAYVGGLAGSNLGTVSNSYSTGGVTGDNWVGGLVGFDFEEGTVSSSYSTANVISVSYAGGLIGGNAGTVNRSYSTGHVTGNSGAGGLIAANSGTVINSYSTGSVTGNDYLGGLIAYNEGTVSGSFWDIETSGQSASDGGTGKNTTEMKSVVTFSDAGWNIIAVANLDTRDVYYNWNIVSGVTYPFLGWQP
jgi:hypothetical protein